VKQGAVTSHDAAPGLRFALAKFRPTALPATLVIRSALHDRLTAGAGERLTVVVGSAASPMPRVICRRSRKSSERGLLRIMSRWWMRDSRH